MAEISLRVALMATFTAAQYAITAISRYHQSYRVGREVASFKCLCDEYSTSTFRQGIHLSGDFIPVLDAAKIRARRTHSVLESSSAIDGPELLPN